MLYTDSAKQTAKLTPSGDEDELSCAAAAKLYPNIKKELKESSATHPLFPVSHSHHCGCATNITSVQNFHIVLPYPIVLDCLEL